jgi:hypothetical protein
MADRATATAADPELAAHRVALEIAIGRCRRVSCSSARSIERGHVTAAQPSRGLPSDHRPRG